jgi:phage I-like protein
MKFLTATCSILLPEGTPEWVHLMPLGAIKGRDGREWKLADPQAVVTASSSRGIDAVIDYEHQTDLAEKNGQPAPAAGWIKEFQVRTDGIWGRVDWTALAAERIQAKEYRYLSPTFLHRKSGEVVAILRAALTNVPDLYLTALATEQDDDSMEELLKALRAALGLQENASQETAIAKVADLVKSAATATSAATALATARKALGLADDADAKAIETAIATARQKADVDPKAFVPRAEFDRVATSLTKLQTDLSADKATEAVEAAMRDGKIAPASKDWAVAYAKKDAEGFADYVKGAPVVVTPGGGGNPTPSKAGSPLTEDELATCRQLGLTEEAFKKTRDAEVTR